MRPLRVLDLFSGIGCMSLGLERTGGFRTVAFCEIDPFCRRILAKHWPDVPVLHDVTQAEFPDADVVVGGFPCQDVSRAGKRAGVTGERSGLYRELVRALRVVRPSVAVVENVAALLGDGMDAVLGDLAESGFDAEWDCVPAEALGAPHERDRVFIVAHADGQRVPHCGFGPTISAPGQSAGNIREWQRLRPDAVTASCTGGGGEATDAQGVGRGQGRSGRPPDSFARVRDEACRNAADPLRARLSFGQSLETDSRSQLPAAERATVVDERKSLWPDEPALCGVDDGPAHRVDRIRALGNALLPQIPELIGRAILQAQVAA